MPAQARTNPPATQTAPKFDVVAIHQNIADESGRSHIWSSPFDGQFRTMNVSLKALIHWAFEMPEERIFGTPSWAGSTFFDIDAKADPALDVMFEPLSSDSGREVKEKMVQGLLADRFKLVAHTENCELPIFALTVAKRGATLGDLKQNGTTINSGRDHIQVQGGNSVELLAEQLSRVSGRIVIDETGIAGRYDVRLKWTPDDPSSADLNGRPGSGPPPDSGPSLFTALEEQLGPKLVPKKGQVLVLVVDNVEMPSQN
jgi:uncharacterized protein (TIGR03435 family)